MAAPAIGLLGKVATGKESTWGTAVTVDRFLGFDSFSMRPRTQVLESDALGLNTSVNLRKGNRRVQTAQWADGDINFECVTSGQGRLWENLFGGTSTIAQQAATPAYLQTHALGSQVGKGLTIQGQFRDEANTEVESFTFSGCKLIKASFTNSNRGKLMCAATVDARNFTTATAAATFSAPAAATPFHFKQAKLTVGGVEVATVTDWQLDFERALATERFFASSSNPGLKAEQIANDFPSVTGTMTAEFDTPATYYDRFAADSAHALIIEYTGVVISGIYSELLRFTIPEIHFGDGATPEMSGPGLVVPQVSFTGQTDASGTAGIKLELISVDTSI